MFIIIAILEKIIKKNKEKRIMDNVNEMPLGLAFQLSMREGAMENFAKLSESQKQQIIMQAKSANTKDELRQLVDSIEG